MIKLFKIALAQEDISMAEFARQHNVSRQFLSDVLANRRKSPRLEAAVKEYTRYRLRQLHIKLDNLKSLNGDKLIN